MRIAMIGLMFVCGCMTAEPSVRSNWFGRFSGAAPDSAEMLAIDVALVEQPLGDRYLNGELWTATDEQTVGLDHKAALEDNGFRVGLIGGIPPGRLQAMLTQERSCINPHQVQMRPGQAKAIHLGPPKAHVEFDLQQDSKPSHVKLDSAQSQFGVVPTRTADGRVKLVIVPQIQHNSRLALPTTSEGWAFGGQRPTEKYNSMSFEATLGPQDYLVIGTRFEKPKSLGFQGFTIADETKPVQRVLVIRARSMADPNALEPIWMPDQKGASAAAKFVPSLAFQATYRGSGE